MTAISSFWNSPQFVEYFKVLIPLIVLTGLALSPGIDAIAQPLVALFGGRQFARPCTSCS